jgi:putative Mg2+ transporter-C (MgtC) family protein
MPIDLMTHTFALRLCCAILLGSLVGLERQWRQRMAGTRTNALVAAGASAFVMAGFVLHGDGSASGRIVSYVVSGVGFLGAGVIFKDGANVRGLNTAATIWCSAAIGVLSGLGSWTFAIVLAAAVVMTNILLRPIAYRLHPVLPEAEPIETSYEIELVTRASDEIALRSVLLAAIQTTSVSLQSVYSEVSPDERATIRAEVRSVGRRNDLVEQIVLRLSVDERTTSVRWAMGQSVME